VWRYSFTYSLTSALDGGEWSASRPGRFTPGERAPGTHWIGGWVGRRAVLDAVVKRKIPSPRRESNPRTPIVQPVAQRYTDWAITALTWDKYREDYSVLRKWTKWRVLRFVPSLCIDIVIRYRIMTSWQVTTRVYPKVSGLSHNQITTTNTRWEAIQSVMAAKLTRLTHKIAIQLRLVAESCNICSSRFRWPVRKLLVTVVQKLILNRNRPEGLFRGTSNKSYTLRIRCVMNSED
jgi:hypothetical protein